MKNDKTFERSINQFSTNENELKKAILFNGDIDAYNSLSIAYLDYSFQEEFLLYAMIMANKYKYPQAYFDVFTCLTDIYFADISKIDEETANLAIEYLLKAYNKGHHQAKDMVEEFSIVNNQNNIQQVERIFKE
jgi:hypothetical protein